MRGGVLVPTIAFALCACGEAPEPQVAADGVAVPAVAEVAVDTTARAWRDVIEQDHDSKSAVPEPFRVQGSVVRVVTRLGPLITPLSDGVVVVNLFPGNSPAPLETLRFELAAPDTLVSDTALVQVPAGGLQLYVAHVSGLRSWRVAVQEAF